MMTMDNWSCTVCHTEQPAGPSPYHWDAFVMEHLPCDDLALIHRDRLTEHDDLISKSQTVWALRLIIAVTTLMLMVGMHLTGAYPYQWAGIGCVFFVSLLFFFEHDPAKGTDQ